MIAAGGGAFARPDTRALLQEGARHRLAALRSRDRCSRACRPTAAGPLAGNRDIMRALLAEREPSYGMADVVVDASTGTPARGRRPGRGARSRSAREATGAAMRYLILSDIHANREALAAVLAHVRRKRWDKAVVLGDVVGYGANPNQASRWSGRSSRSSRSAATTTRSARASRTARCSTASRCRPPHVDAPQADALEPALAAVAAGRAGDRGRRVRDRPRHADRRGRLHLRRDRGAERLPPDGVPALLLRALALPRDLRPLARRDPDRAHRAAVLPLPPRAGRALPREPGLDRPAARRQPARLLRDVRQRHADGRRSTASRTAVERAQRKILDAGLPRPLADRLALGR